MDVSVELAVCHILLGDLSSALSTLRLKDGSQPAPDPDVREYVMSMANSEKSFDAGVYALAERWIRTVLAAEMRGFVHGRTFTLAYWNSLPQVCISSALTCVGLPRTGRDPEIARDQCSNGHSSWWTFTRPAWVAHQA